MREHLGVSTLDGAHHAAAVTEAHAGAIAFLKQSLG